MEDLAPPYHFILELIYELESGGVVRSAVKKYLETHNNSFCLFLKQWLNKQQLGESAWQLPPTMSSYQKAIWDLLELSQQGASLMVPLYELEKELRFVCEEQLEQHLSLLPYKLMIPLLFFQFPALLLLLIGPLIGQLLTEVSQ